MIDPSGELDVFACYAAGRVGPQLQVHGVTLAPQVGVVVQGIGHLRDRALEAVLGVVGTFTSRTSRSPALSQPGSVSKAVVMASSVNSSGMATSNGSTQSIPFSFDTVPGRCLHFRTSRGDGADPPRRAICA